jgi:hypothetical protein
MTVLTIREEIAEALRVGLGDAFVKFEEWDDATDVHTTFCDEPITVWRDHIDMPDEYSSEVRSAIALDVHAILADIVPDNPIGGSDE